MTLSPRRTASPTAGRARTLRPVNKTRSQSFASAMRTRTLAKQRANRGIETRDGNFGACTLCRDFKLFILNHRRVLSQRSSSAAHVFFAPCEPCLLSSRISEAMPVTSACSSAISYPTSVSACSSCFSRPPCSSKFASQAQTPPEIPRIAISEQRWPQWRWCRLS